MTWVAWQSTSPVESVPLPDRAKSSSHPRSRTWSPAPGSTSWTGASTNSKVCRDPGSFIARLHDFYRREPPTPDQPTGPDTASRSLSCPAWREQRWYQQARAKSVDPLGWFSRDEGADEAIERRRCIVHAVPAAFDQCLERLVAAENEERVGDALLGQPGRRRLR